MHGDDRITLVTDHTMLGESISDRDFARFQQLIRRVAGIHLSPAKKPLLCGRLAKRLRSRGVPDYAAYYELVSSGADARETETCIDLLTTNETSFFREPGHFELLRRQVLPALRGARECRVWSAACSSGEEVYTIAMVIAETLGLDASWSVLGSDISTAMLAKAASACYALERAQTIPRRCLERYCLKGVGSRAGSFAFDAPLRAHVRFAQINLNEALPQLPPFDAIYLRNVLFYFAPEVKRAVVERLAEQLAPGGWLFVGHAESLNGIGGGLCQVAQSAYRKAP